ncbi:Tom37 metaxin N-terminal-like domain-containing protein [Bradyrhizobium neotropicale]|uniref:Tom37 metaxin N-terminal-like domain-containing protein n=1 Tax=Bradyrhizobium neotropicale TaxID=1497615 RepID=UPI001FED5283|nr:Tom37 metaxin N-terminal-like domain-containing protein [Bradyrhizobium neotropicale]
MLTLYSYPPLFGVADNNGYGLKVFAFLKLAGVPFRHEHIFDASKAPRGQLPYIVDGRDSVGDSETILAYATEKYGVTLDVTLTPAQRATDLLITRTLDDLYWVMSYSRWKAAPSIRQSVCENGRRLAADAARLAAAAAAIRNGDITSETYTTALLQRARALAELNAFITIDGAAVLAARADKARAAGSAAPLLSVPLGGEGQLVDERAATSLGLDGVAHFVPREDTDMASVLFVGRRCIKTPTPI